MKRTNNYFFIPCTLAFCAMAALILGGCQTNEENTFVEDQYAQQDVYIEQDAFINETAAVNTPEPADMDSAFIDSLPTANITVVNQEETIVVNPYLEEEKDTTYVAVNEKAKNPCYQVQNGKIVGKASAAEATTKGLPCTNTDYQAVTDTVQKSGAPKEKTTAPKETGLVNIETPARCEVALKGNKIITSVPLNAAAFKMNQIDNSDSLPRFEVNNYTFKDVPLDLAIQNLVSEAGIRVYSDDALFPEVSGENIRGELTAVINELTAAGDVFYRYNAAKKQLILSRWARFNMQVPGGRVGMYTILDALRGANITNIHPDFGANEIYMRINKENEKVIAGLIDTIKASPELLMFDIKIYRLTKGTNAPAIDWQNLVQDFGVKKINTSVNGLMGRVLTMGHQPAHKTLVDSLRAYGSVQLISEGVAVMPEGWKVRFDIGQCAKFQTPEQELSMLFQSTLLKDRRAESNIALDTMNGELTSFHTFYNIDDSLNIIGIPGRVFNPAWKNNVEYVITLKPRMLRLVK